VIIPESTQGTQAWDRYGYVNNSPVNYNDPTGHAVAGDTNENGCSGEGVKCIVDMYGGYGDPEGMDDSLRSYFRRNPTYSPFSDPSLPENYLYVVSNAKFQAEVQAKQNLCNCTLELSYGFTAMTFLGGFRGSFGIAIDGNGNIGLVGSFGGGADIVAALGHGLALTATNASSLSQLRGLTTQFGGQIGQGATVGAEYVGGRGYSGISVFGANAVLGFIPAEVYGTVTNSWILPVNTWR